MTILTIYLDNSDYSRIANWLAQRGEEVVGEALRKLLKFRDAGKIQFVNSMALLSEPLQYEGGGRELTLRKARTVNFLCEGRAFRHHGRLLAAQAAGVARDAGLIRTARFRVPCSISTNDGWYPAIGSIVQDIRSEGRQAAIAEVAQERGLNRKDRRHLAATARRSKFATRANYSAEILNRILEIFPIDAADLARLLPRLMNDKIPPHVIEAEFFGEITKPERFVTLYYERYSGDQTMLSWMKEIGTILYEGILRLREQVSGLDQLGKVEKRQLKEQLAAPIHRLACRFVGVLTDEFKEIGLPPSVMREVADDQNLLMKMPFFDFIGKVVPELFVQSSGLYRGGRAPKDSDGGDLFHALHIPYCDFWRGDSYFSDLVRRCMPDYRDNIISKLVDLPAAIEARLS